MGIDRIVGWARIEANERGKKLRVFHIDAERLGGEWEESQFIVRLLMRQVSRFKRVYLSNFNLCIHLTVHTLSFLFVCWSLSKPNSRQMAYIIIRIYRSIVNVCCCHRRCPRRRRCRARCCCCCCVNRKTCIHTHTHSHGVNIDSRLLFTNNCFDGVFICHYTLEFSSDTEGGKHGAYTTMSIAVIQYMHSSNADWVWNNDYFLSNEKNRIQVKATKRQELSNIFHKKKLESFVNNTIEVNIKISRRVFDHLFTSSAQIKSW